MVGLEIDVAGQSPLAARPAARDGKPRLCGSMCFEKASWVESWIRDGLYSLLATIASPKISKTGRASARQQRLRRPFPCTMPASGIQGIHPMNWNGTGG